MGTTNILIVEDDKLQRTLIRKVIDNGQRQIAEVETAQDGLRYAQDNPVDILLLDLSLPGRFDGFSLWEALRRNKRFADTKVIIITGYDDPQDRIDAENLNIDHYLVKPVNAAELQALIARLEA
ncbi:response regulator [Propionivibrio dicarboxylicus]|uniref:Response regulator receiver domain-containing protein n=1 Tax=Propionivibrio dicarboxylicus TaxID=83767 RepID=A0A1G8NUW0_9RHOO|nr:response regulator [Propionivibrio dicarboxylicus]SDI83994.1 Response regulator receiver domain-containing protein [Propionivibrio dicarboxylicus]